VEFCENALPSTSHTGIVLHGTSGILVKDNVAFHVDGNCFYLEDGVEEHNWIEGNFAGFIHPIGIPAGGFDQTGTLHVQVCTLSNSRAFTVDRQRLDHTYLKVALPCDHILSLTACRIYQQVQARRESDLLPNTLIFVHCLQEARRIQPVDAAASGFYSGNPNNVWLGNAASGGWAGFSFPALPKPIKVIVFVRMTI